MWQLKGTTQSYSENNNMVHIIFMGANYIFVKVLEGHIRAQAMHQSGYILPFQKIFEVKLSYVFSVHLLRLADHDVVVTTYGLVSKEISVQKEEAEKPSKDSDDVV